MDIFYPEDFEDGYLSSINGKQQLIFTQYMASIANKIFNEWLEKQPIVYTNFPEEYKNNEMDTRPVWFHKDGPLKHPDRDDYIDKFSAKIVDIQPIEKPCEHTIEPWPADRGPVFHIAGQGDFIFKCTKCGIEIKPTGWKEI